MFNYPKWKIALIGIIAGLGIFFCIPNFYRNHNRKNCPNGGSR